MKTNPAVIVLIFVTLGTIIVGCSEKKVNSMKQQSQVEKKTEENIIRDGVIDVAAIDVNKDGKVFQCPMDWNVLSDKQESCPTCGMDLEEVNITKAKENLIKNDYKVK